MESSKISALPVVNNYKFKKTFSYTLISFEKDEEFLNL